MNKTEKLLAGKPKAVKIDLSDLMMLCLGYDYIIEGDCKEIVEGISVEMGRKYGFDTH